MSTITFEKNESKNYEWKCLDNDSDPITVELNASALTINNGHSGVLIMMNYNVVDMLKDIVKHLEETNTHYQTCIGQI